MLTRLEIRRAIERDLMGPGFEHQNLISGANPFSVDVHGTSLRVESNQVLQPAPPRSNLAPRSSDKRINPPVAGVRSSAERCCQR